LSFTIGIAFATLLVAAGILAGPAVVDCQHQSQSLGACLRGKVVDSGLVEPDAVPATPAGEEAAQRPPGWIEANATEYETPASGLAQLSAEPGEIDAYGALPTAEIGADVALVDPDASVRADGLVPLSRPSGEAALAPIITGSIDATGGIPGAGPSGDTSMEPPVLPAPPTASGRAGTTAPGRGRASLAPQLIADLSPVPPLAEVLVAPVPKTVPQLIPRPLAPTAAARLKPEPQPKPRPPKYDPRYPNVLVLPPPNTGENSSFATLELR
jgi:hypothetical protein